MLRTDRPQDWADTTLGAVDSTVVPLAPRRKRLPYGTDKQGRYPEAAEPCTDIGADDEAPSLLRAWGVPRYRNGALKPTPLPTLERRDAPGMFIARWLGFLAGVLALVLAWHIVARNWSAISSWFA